MISGGIDKCGCVYYKDGIVRGQVSAEGMKNMPIPGSQL